MNFGGIRGKERRVLWWWVGLACVALCVAFMGGVRAGEPPAAAGSSPHVPRVDPLTMEGEQARNRGRLGRRHSPSPLLIPDQFIPLRFSHVLHMDDLECTDCHGSAEMSVRSSDVNLPEEEGCLDCHDVEQGHEPGGGDPPARCSTCHPGYTPSFPEGVSMTDTSRATVHPPRSVLPKPRIKFNHRIHVNKNIPCTQCHGGVKSVGFATRENALPVMGDCMTCHDGKEAPDECSVCHLTRPDGRLKQVFPEGVLAPAGWYRGDAHDERWLNNHRVAAQADPAYCESCHAPTECVDCHNGIRKPLRIHPNDWIIQHPIAARKNSPDCSSCHRSQTFCVQCHEATKVAWNEPGQRPGHMKFHPDGWSSSVVTGPDHHAIQARRNMRTCVSCHTENTCLTCHSAQTLGVNPHPPGFGTSARCRRMLQANPRVCTKCHTTGDPALNLCR